MEGLGVNPDFWKGRKVLLTGHTGFKGSWLSLWLADLGAQLSGFALQPPTQPSLFEQARVDEIMESHIGDIRDYSQLLDRMQAAAPEIVIHMAAQPLVRYSYAHPIETYATNVMGTVHLLEAARAVPTVRAVLVITSDKCYENREWFWGYREDEPMGGYDPYSSSKGCAELVTSAYRRSYFGPAGRQLAVASARAGNVIGGGDWAEGRLIPDMLRGFAAQQPVVVRNPLAVRPWQHVLEPLAGYLTLAQALVEQGLAVSEAWNFGPADDDVHSVQWIADCMVALWGGDARWKLDRAAQPHEAAHLKLDSSKARARLGWRPRWALEAAMRRIVEWQHAMLDGADMRQVTLNQIRDYQST